MAVFYHRELKSVNPPFLAWQTRTISALWAFVALLFDDRGKAAVCRAVINSALQNSGAVRFTGVIGVIRRLCGNNIRQNNIILTPPVGAAGSQYDDEYEGKCGSSHL